MGPIGNNMQRSNFQYFHDRTNFPILLACKTCRRQIFRINRKICKLLTDYVAINGQTCTITALWNGKMKDGIKKPNNITRGVGTIFKVVRPKLGSE